MNPERWQQIKRLYNSALELEPARREAFLQEACAGDDSLRKEIERLLAQKTEAEDLLGKPALEVAARALAQDRKDKPQPDYVGRSLLHYRIIEKIGEGGMGVVYQAQDTHLNRPVAIKVLPEVFAEDAEKMARFEREARLLATLNDPNIASIHGLEKQYNRSFLVLELVEGLTLEERLKKGPIPIDEALDICCQIADGLETAHDKGVIHRDLKPANVKLTPEGKVKILDFGLAKALHGQADSVDLTAKDADSMTASGVILGTAAYMSPEQARGRPVDKRTDIWAFGCVLYECLTARKAFEGETLSETVAAILRDDPDWNAIPASTPRNVRGLLHRCLRKDLKARFRDIGDARIELEEAKAATFDRTERTPIGGKSDRRSALGCEGEIREFEQEIRPREATDRKKKPPYAWAVAAISVVIVVVASMYWISRREPRESGPVLVPVPLATYQGMALGASFSPDGNQVAFAWNGEKQDNWDIYIKQIGNESPRRLTTDLHADFWPAWSPDGQSIAFLRSYDEVKAAVMLIPAIGGRERQVTEVQLLNVAGGKFFSWHPGGKWLAVACDQKPEDAPSSIYLISPETREIRRLTSPPRGVRSDTSPAFSPDGRSLAFARYVGSSGELFMLRVSADLMPEGEPKQLTFMDQDTCFPSWMPDGKEIIFASGSKSHTARLWRIPASGSGQPRILPFALEGGVLDLAVARRQDRLVYALWFPDENIWRFEIPKPGMKPLAPQRFLASSRPQEEVQFSPDGRSVAYGSWDSGSKEIWVCDRDGKNPAQLTHLGGPIPHCLGWSPDGQQIMFHFTAAGNSDLYSVPVQGGRTKRLTSTPSNEGHPCYSRDGKWVYFGSDRTGDWQIWKMPAEGGEAVQITRKGGYDAEESMDGKTLLYGKRKGRGSVSGGLKELWEVPADGGEESRVLDEVYHWSFDVRQRGIYFVSKPDRDGTQLLFYEFYSRKTKLVATIPQEVGGGFTVSPDDQTVLYGVLLSSRLDLMLVENFR